MRAQTRLAASAGPGVHRATRGRPRQALPAGPRAFAAATPLRKGNAHCRRPRQLGCVAVAPQAQPEPPTDARLRRNGRLGGRRYAPLRSARPLRGNVCGAHEGERAARKRLRCAALINQTNDQGNDSAIHHDGRDAEIRFVSPRRQRHLRRVCPCGARECLREAQVESGRRGGG